MSCRMESPRGLHTRIGHYLSSMEKQQQCIRNWLHQSTKRKQREKEDKRIGRDRSWQLTNHSQSSTLLDEARSLQHLCRASDAFCPSYVCWRAASLFYPERRLTCPGDDTQTCGIPCWTDKKLSCLVIPNCVHARQKMKVSKKCLGLSDIAHARDSG